MAATPVDLGQLKQGEDQTITITCQKANPDYPGDGVDNPDDLPKYLVLDLTGYVNPECEIRKDDKITGKLIMVPSPTPVFIEPRSTGRISFDIPYETSLAAIWKFDRAYFDMFVYDPTGTRICIAECSFTLDPSTTRPLADR